MNKKAVDIMATVLIGLAALFSSVVLLIILVYIFVQGLPVISLEFITTSPHGVEASGGIFSTIVASFYVTALAMLVVTPIGVGAAIYLAHYATPGRLVRSIRFGADALASVPSIVFGLFGLTFFVYILGFGWSMLSGGLTLAVMILPLIMRTAEEAILAVPRSYVEGSFALGTTRWQTISNIVLPSASPRILTGVILGTGRAFGETAAVLFTAGLAINVPLLLTDPGRTMTNHLFLLSTEGISLSTAYGTAVLLTVIILVFNLLARRILARITT